MNYCVSMKTRGFFSFLWIQGTTRWCREYVLRKLHMLTFRIPLDLQKNTDYIGFCFVFVFVFWGGLVCFFWGGGWGVALVFVVVVVCFCCCCCFTFCVIKSQQ